MSAKKRKGQSPWSVCDNCNVIIAQKDALLHKEKSCPPTLQTWIHPYIKDCQLYSTIEIYYSNDESVKHTPRERRNDFVLMPYHVLQLCKIPIGTPVIITPSDNDEITSFVKLAWPIQKEEKCSDFTVALSNEVINLNNLEPKGSVLVCQIKENLSLAEQVTLVCESDISSIDVPSLLSRIQSQNINKIYRVNNKLSINQYGCQFLFKISEIISFDIGNSNVSEFHQITLETNWKIHSNEPLENKPSQMLDKLGGLNSTITDLKDIISIALSGKSLLSGLQITRGILIHGPAGTGKSTLMEGIAYHFTRNIVRIEGAKIFNKFSSETNNELQNCFEKAEQICPSIILIDDIDVLCSKSNSSTDYEKRITATLSMLMDKLNGKPDSSVVVLATTTKLHQIDKMLRCPNRFGKEVEIYVPNSPQRFEIMKLLLTNVHHNLKEDDIKEIANSSHGFVGADLVSLVSKAILRNFKNSEGREIVSINDFHWALNKVKPSAMREIMIEVPNVKWSDIGGQEDLKLKLRQSVEWPLKYYDSFTKLGIVPPKGLLMFGPPGCSKTMIAKALATESNLNFISVKGPELFSKWVGESERAVRKVFQKARQTAPSIIFFDELDAIGGERNISSGSNVQERVLAQLLTELDGVEPLENVTVIGATNRLDRIDPALLRPGRFDRIIYVPLPDSKTRQEIFHIQLQKTSISNDVIVEELVDKTEGYSGAEIIAVCREAALKALEENIIADVVTREHFLYALSIVVPRTPKSLLEMYEKYLTRKFSS